MADNGIPHNEAIKTWAINFPKLFMGREITWGKEFTGNNSLKGTVRGVKIIECGCMYLELDEKDWLPLLLISKGESCLTPTGKYECKIPNAPKWNLWLTDELFTDFEILMREKDAELEKGTEDGDS